MHFGNFTEMKGISQDFSDCRLHNDKYTKFQPCNNWAHIVPQYIGWSSRHTNALHLTAGFIMVGYPFEFILIRLIHNIVVVDVT